MKLKSLENKAIVNIGLKNIKNPLFKAFFEVDRRAEGKDINPVLVGFYFAPIINAIIRIGTIEDKHYMFQGFIGATDGVEALSSMISLKGKQDRNKDKIIPLIVYALQKSNEDKDNVIIAKAPPTLFSSATGLVAGNLANQYCRPTLLGRVRGEDFVGSIRSLNDSNVENFKDFCEESGLFNWVAGKVIARTHSFPLMMGVI